MGMADLFFGMQDPDKWRRLTETLQRWGTTIDPSQSGGVAPRANPSRHPGGGAMDFNYNDNPVGSSTNYMPSFDVLYGTPEMVEKANQPRTQITPDIARMAAAQEDLKWGGDFRHLNTGQPGPDPHHFEDPRVALSTGAPHVPNAPLGAPGARPFVDPSIAMQEARGPSVLERMLGPGVGRGLANAITGPGFFPALMSIGSADLGRIGLGMAQGY